MPAHSCTRGAAAIKAPKAVSAPKKAAGGRALGKAALRAMTKNAEAVSDLISLLESDTDISTHHYTLARVVRPVGAGRLEVTLMDGTNEVNLPICGKIRFKGRAASKGDRANCMIPGDIVVIAGSQLAAKCSRSAAIIIRLHLERLRISYPKNFFAAASVDADEEDEEDAFEFDRDEDAEAAEAAEVMACRAVSARAKALRMGVATTESDDETLEAEANRKEDDEDVVFVGSEAPKKAEAPAAAGGGGPNRPSPSGLPAAGAPNRKERRAAAAAAQALTEEEAERRAFLLRNSLASASEDKTATRLNSWIDSI